MIDISSLSKTSIVLKRGLLRFSSIDVSPTRLLRWLAFSTFNVFFSEGSFTRASFFDYT